MPSALAKVPTAPDSLQPLPRCTRRLTLSDTGTLVVGGGGDGAAIKEIKQLAAKGAPRCPLATSSHLVLKNDSLASAPLQPDGDQQAALVALANSVYVQKHVVGAVSGRKGEVIIEISIAASRAASTIRVLLLDYVPWYFTVYFHTMSAQLSGRPVSLEHGMLRSSRNLEARRSPGRSPGFDTQWRREPTSFRARTTGEPMSLSST